MGELPGRNDACWCGSGKKYKKCHLNREQEKRLPPGAIVDALQREHGHSECLHPLAGPNVCDAIIAAHSIQRSRLLEKIIDSSNGVLTFFPATLRSDGGIKVHRVGWRKASTFTGFCAKHDSATFRPLETAPFSSTPQQCFLTAYRALCHEIYLKSDTLKPSAVPQMLERGLPMKLQKEIQEFFAIASIGSEKGLRDLRRLKSFMDHALLKSDYSGLSYVVIHFRGDLCICSTGAITPSHDFDGKELQVLHDPGAALQQLLFGIVATDDGGAVVFAWLKEEHAPGRFVGSLLKRGHRELADLLVQFIFMHIENTFFSPSWWDSLSDIQRLHLTKLASIPIPYYQQYRFVSSSLVSWEISNVTVHGGHLDEPDA